MNSEIRRRYMVTVEFLAETLGPCYEIVLQEFDDENSGIIAIANGEISGRKVGSPITSTALQMIMDRRYETQDYVLNYTGKTPSGNTLRSSTMFIKDEGKLVGMLCINFDDSKYREMYQRFLGFIHPDKFFAKYPGILQEAPNVEPLSSNDYLIKEEKHELFQSDTESLMKEIFDAEEKTFGTTLERLTQDERMQFVDKLYGKGLFNVKGSVQYAAQRLGCSQASVYRYVKKAKDEHENK